MLSLRSFARTAPRTISRIASQSARASLSRTPSLLQQTWRQPALSRMGAAFSTTVRRPQVIEELAAKLDSEISHEKDQASHFDFSSNLEQFQQSTGFKVHDTPGNEEVTFTRDFGDEHIEVKFSVADLQSADFNEQLSSEDDSAYYDEEDDLSAQSGGANTKGAVNRGRTPGGNVRVEPEDRVAPADRPELNDESFPEDDDMGDVAFPVRVTVKVTRQGQKGALLVETVAQDGEFSSPEYVYFFPSSEQADPSSADADWKRKNVYAGPPFENLDEELKGLVQKYLEERGIDTAMATFLPEYVDFKEQKEYIRWLENVKGFFA